MSYLICESCNGYYELKEGESPDDFENCHCGGNLRYLDEIIVDETPPPRRKVIKKGKTFTANKSEEHIIIMFFGAIIALVGAIGIYWGYGYSFFIVIAGLTIVIFGYKEGGSWIKGDIGERITSHHLEKLPKEYVVFNDVNLPERYGNIDHVVVGPTGIFVIETKNYTGSYIIDGDDWYYNSNQGVEKASSNPAGQVKSNSMALKRYLSIKGVNTYRLWINSVVALNSHSLIIKNEPQNYVVLNHQNYLLSFKREVMDLNKIQSLKLSILSKIVPLKLFNTWKCCYLKIVSYRKKWINRFLEISEVYFPINDFNITVLLIFFIYVIYP